MKALIRTIFPVAVPSKTRLLATLAECSRIVKGLPDPVCTVLEKTGVVASWRLQLETLSNAQGRLVNLNVQDAASLAQQVIGIVNRARGKR